jgi:hypothetical protein
VNPRDAEPVRLDLDIAEGVGGLGGALPEDEHTKTLTAEKCGAQKRLQMGSEKDDVVEARRHGPYTSGAVSDRVASPSGAFT